MTQILRKISRRRREAWKFSLFSDKLGRYNPTA